MSMEEKEEDSRVAQVRQEVIMKKHIRCLRFVLRVCPLTA